MLHHNCWCWWHWDRVDRHRRHTHARVVAGRFGLGLGQIDIEQGFDDVVDEQGLEVGNGFHHVLSWHGHSVCAGESILDQSVK